MRVRVTVEEAAGTAEAQALYKWLSRDPDVVGSTALSLMPRDDQAPGHMGPVLDMIDVVFEVQPRQEVH